MFGDKWIFLTIGSHFPHHRCGITLVALVPSDSDGHGLGWLCTMESNTALGRGQDGVAIGGIDPNHLLTGCFQR